MTEVIVDVRTVRFDVPEGLLPRGLVVVFAGRGETPEVYARLGGRLSADAYAVLVFGDEPDASAADLAAAVTAWAGGFTVAPEGFERRLSVIGSDTGVLRAIDVATALGPQVDAVVLAGYPAAVPAERPLDWEDELRERTTCPLHRRTLDADPGVGRGGFGDALVGADLHRDLGGLTPAVLAIHGGADLLSPFEEVLPVYRSARGADIWVVDGAKHDVLNDGAHRTAAATIVLFLEGRRSPGLLPLARRVDETTRS